jgi:hypothetical protein
MLIVIIAATSSRFRLTSVEADAQVSDEFRTPAGSMIV